MNQFGWHSRWLVICVCLLLSATVSFAQTPPAWQPGVSFSAGALATFNGQVYKCLQSHTSMVGWEPPNVPALWQLQPGSPTPNPNPNPGPTLAGTDQLSVVFTPGADNGQTFTGTLTVANTNKTYAWNGSFFDLFNIQCSTAARLTSANTPNGPAQFTNQTGGVVIDLTWQSMIGLGVTIPITIQGTDNGSKPTFSNCAPNYVRGSTAIYPQYAGLPASWQKNKANLSSADLIANPTSYYTTTLPPVADKMIVYHPTSPTQVELNQVMSMPVPVNVVNNVRIWIPSRFMAMGLAFAYEFFKFNPNFLAGIGTKENFAAGLVPASAGFASNPITLNGIPYFWPIVGNSPDGPFQQETGNFNDAVSIMPDYLPANAVHGDYTTINVTSANRDDPKWISAALSAAISLTVTRESLNAIPAAQFLQFIQQAKDPWAEQAVTAFAYNQGINSLLPTKLFTAGRTRALNSQDVAADFNLAGFGSYVATVRAITDALNNDTSNTYDAMLTPTDIDTFFTQLRKFYANGVPADTTYNAMKTDVQRAFRVLAQHWGGSTVSFRYDFLTLLRVAEQYLPKPINPRPTGSSWYFLVKNSQP